MRKAILLCSLLALFGGFLQAQQTKVTGRVTDASGNPIEGISVGIKGKSTGAVTNTAGQFSITAASGETLVFSSVGLVSKEVKVTGSSLQAKMETSNATLSEVVEIGRAHV